MKSGGLETFRKSGVLCLGEELPKWTTGQGKKKENRHNGVAKYSKIRKAADHCPGIMWWCA
jgi:hypothetical protein